MAVGKSTFFLLMGLLAVQALNTVELSADGDVVEQLLEQLKKVVQDAIDGALETLGGLFKQIESAAEEFEQTLNNTLVAACRPFIKAIEDAVETARNAGVDVVECVGTSEDDILDLPAQLLRNVSSCVTSKVNEANVILNDINNDINSTINIVFGIANQIQACEEGSIFNLPLCLAEVAKNITEKIASVPLQIAKDVAKANHYVASFLPSLAACDFGANAALALEAGEIAGNVTSCIAEKLVNSNSTTSADSSTTESSNSTTTTASSNSTATTESSNSTATTAASNSTATTSSSNSTATTASSNSTATTASTTTDSTTVSSTSTTESSNSTTASPSNSTTESSNSTTASSNSTSTTAANFVYLY